MGRGGERRRASARTQSGIEPTDGRRWRRPLRRVCKGEQVVTALNADKVKALEAVTAQIERQFGKGAIMRYGDGMPDVATDSIPTGSIALDLALGVGGIPRGRVVEVYG